MKDVTVHYCVDCEYHKIRNTYISGSSHVCCSPRIIEETSIVTRELCHPNGIKCDTVRMDIHEGAKKCPWYEPIIEDKEKP